MIYLHVYIYFYLFIIMFTSQRSPDHFTYFPNRFTKTILKLSYISYHLRRCHTYRAATELSLCLASHSIIFVTSCTVNDPEGCMCIQSGDYTIHLKAVMAFHNRDSSESHATVRSSVHLRFLAGTSAQYGTEKQHQQIRVFSHRIW